MEQAAEERILLLEKKVVCICNETTLLKAVILLTRYVTSMERDNALDATPLCPPSERLYFVPSVGSP